MKKLILVLGSGLFCMSAFSAENPLKQIKKQMCFESYPRITYDQTGTHEWTVNEVISNPIYYKTYKLISSNKTKLDNASAIYDFSGISRQYGKIVPVTGSGSFSENAWTLYMGSSTKLGQRYSINNEPYATSLATWDMYSNINQPGTSGGFMKFESVPPNPDNNFYEVSVVKTIDCKDFSRNYPALN